MANSYTYETDCSKDVVLDCAVAEPGGEVVSLLTGMDPVAPSERKGPANPTSHTIPAAQLSSSSTGLATMTLQVVPAVISTGKATVLLRAKQADGILTGFVTDDGGNKRHIQVNSDGWTVAAVGVPNGHQVVFPVAFECK